MKASRNIVRRWFTTTELKRIWCHSQHRQTRTKVYLKLKSRNRKLDYYFLNTFEVRFEVIHCARVKQKSAGGLPRVRTDILTILIFIRIYWSCTKLHFSDEKRTKISAKTTHRVRLLLFNIGPPWNEFIINTWTNIRPVKNHFYAISKKNGGKTHYWVYIG